jgi:hypothetical protein
MITASTKDELATGKWLQIIQQQNIASYFGTVAQSLRLWFTASVVPTQKLSGEPS